jgi:effector-binding domain-containing protein
MPKIFLSKKIQINANPSAVFAKINDFHQWATWSPWLILEEGVKLDIQEDGKAYSWLGKRTGSGNMKVTSEKQDEMLEMDLNFIKPFKSYAKVGFTVTPTAEGSEVTWTMNSSLPFFLFFMKKMMVAGVGMDYERGLKMLKDFVEDGVVHSKLEEKGASTYAGCNYVGIKGECTIKTMKDDMQGKMEKLMAFSEKNKDNTTGAVFTIYHEWNMKTGKVEYTSAVAVKEAPANLSGGLESGSIPQTKVQSVRHTGPYYHMGNAWSMLYMMKRGKEIKTNNRIDPFEVYVNSPMDTEPNDLITEVYFPVK